MDARKAGGPPDAVAGTVGSRFPHYFGFFVEFPS